MNAPYLESDDFLTFGLIIVVENEKDDIIDDALKFLGSGRKGGIFWS